jgi:hypothetical protein
MNVCARTSSSPATAPGAAACVKTPTDSSTAARIRARRSHGLSLNETPAMHGSGPSTAGHHHPYRTSDHKIGVHAGAGAITPELAETAGALRHGAALLPP